MAERNLPIKFFQKRQKDEQGTEGMGSSALPKWVNVDLFKEKASYVKEMLSEISNSLSAKVQRNNYLPSVIKLKINEDALAKSYRREIGHFFNIGKLNIIGVSGEDEILIKIDNESSLQAIINKFESATNVAFPTNSTIIGISSITNIEEYKPQIDFEFEDNAVLKVKLFNYGNGELNDILVKTFERYCDENNIPFARTSYSSELNIYKLNSVTVDAFQELRDFDGIQLVTEMPTYSVTLDEVSDENTVPIKLPKEGVKYPCVGILDTGIANIPHLAPWITNKKFSCFHEDDVSKSHGTFVAGVLLYGDDLEGKDYTGFEGCNLFEAIVMPDLKKQVIYEDELIENIREAISKHDDIKIWNLSLGTDKEADLNEFSDFAKALDEIQEQHDVLICKSAGNCNNFKVNAPKSRIAKSADTVRGLVVGSLSRNKIGDENNDDVDWHFPSPFSRIGPGPSHLIKPDVVHIGGNAGLDKHNRVVLNPVKSFSINGSLAKNVGTSFSTPRISAIAAGIDFMLNEKFNPLLIKALVIHSAKYPEEMQMSISDKIDAVGFGKPSNISDILFNQPNEITLILQDTLEKGHYVDILDFPYPQSMIDDEGFYYGEITVTLVTSPILEVSQGGEYCQSNIEVKLGSYDTKVDRDTTKTFVKNPIGADGRQNLLYQGLYSKKASRDIKTPFANERMLISYGDKYQPVKKWCVNLDDFTNTNKEKYLKAPKNWFLKVEGFYRNYTETLCEMQKIVPSQEFCLIVTIKDTRNKKNIYNEVTQLLNSYSFVHNNIQINEEVRVRLNN